MSTRFVATTIRAIAPPRSGPAAGRMDAEGPVTMFGWLVLAAALAAAPVEASGPVRPLGPLAPTAPASMPEESTPPPRTSGPLPTGSTQPMAPMSTRPSIGFISAANLAERCQSNSPGLVSYCFAYITGVHDTVRAYETWLRVREFCPPFTSSQSDMRRAFLSYLQGNPDAGTGEAASVIVLAFKDHFSCETKKEEPAAAPKPAKASKKKS